MCSNNEDDFEDALKEMTPAEKPEILPSEATNCNNCGCGLNNADEIYKLPFRKAECKECFLLYSRHKFRAVLGSSKILPKDAEVMLSFDGTAASMVLVEMMHHAQTQNTFKRLHCKAKVLYIDEYSLETQNDKVDRLTRLKKIQQILLQICEQFECYVCNLNFENLKLFNIKTELPQYLEFMQQEEEHLINILQNLQSISSRQDFLKIQRKEILNKAAILLKSEFVMLPDSTNDLATALLTAIALGRGGTAAFDTSLMDNRLNENIKFLRPLRDISQIEIHLYLKAHNITPLKLQDYAEESGASASIQNLTKAFVDNLQVNYPSTVSTVFRTGDKIAPHQQKLLEEDLNNLSLSNKKADKCLLCHNLLDHNDSKTLKAINFSRIVCKVASSLEEKFNLQDIEQNLENKQQTCHACNNILNSASNKELFKLS